MLHPRGVIPEMPKALSGMTWNYSTGSGVTPDSQKWTRVLRIVLMLA